MKKCILLWMVVLTAMGFTACESNDDDYSLGKYWLSYGVIEGEEDSFHLKLDNGEILFPSATAVPTFPIEDGKRVLANYTILDEATGYEDIDYLVKVNWLEEILTKDIIDLTESNADSIGNDPVQLHDIWLGGGFLNVNFAFDGGGTSHMINLVRVESADPKGPVQLELRHNRKDDDDHYWVKATASFRLESIEEAQKDSVEFVVTIKGYEDKSHTFNGTYVYGSNEE
ncbi:MAG: NigD-like protein [Marinifilaceae bacterium]